MLENQNINTTYSLLITHYSLLCPHYKVFGTNRAVFRLKQLKLKVIQEMILQCNQNQALRNNCEQDLLLYCSQTVITPEIEAEIANLTKQKIDWQNLIKMAGFHGVIPLLYQNLKTICPEAIPPATLNQFELHFKLNQINNKFLTEELVKILDFYNDNNITAIPFKGVTLTAMAYGNLALRPFCDLDILVQSQDFIRARNLLISQFNYQPKPGQRQLFPWLLGKIRGDNRHDCTLIRKNDKAIVDLHQKVVGKYYCNFPIESQQLWERCETIDIGETEVLTFHREDLLLILCVHGSKHLWRELKWVCDIAQLIDVSPDINWGRVIDKSEKLGCKRMLLIGLLLTKELFKNTLPTEIEQSIQNDRQCELLAQEICQKIFYVPDYNPNQKTNTREMMIQVLMLDFLKDRLRFSAWLFWHHFISPLFQPFRQKLT